MDAWQPSYLPEFDYAESGAASAYDENAFVQQDELLVADPGRQTYGPGFPHRRNMATLKQGDYLIKVDTGARVNILSVADASRLGYDYRDFEKSPVFLVGFNRAIVQPRGQLRARVRVNGQAFETTFQIVEQCNSPLLCLRDAERAGLVSVARSHQPAPVSEFNYYKHEIVTLKLKPDAVPKQFAPRKVPLALQAQAKSQLNEMLDDGVIERVNEPCEWVHPMQIAFKPDGRLRICMDPRYLNQYLERAIFPFPSLDQVFTSVKGAKFFSKIDLTWGFWNLRLDEASSRLCTFVTPWGVFRYKRLPFGVSPAPEVFHRVLADVLRELPGVLHYVDDVLIYGATREEHDQRLRVVLQRLELAGFAISKPKSVFNKTSVVFLGHLVSGESIRPDPAKIVALQEMLPPTNISEHRGLMGFVNFLAQYLPHFSALTEPLRRLQSGKTLFKWTEDQQRSFELLKQLFAEEPCLAPFDEQAPLTLATDASSTGLGAVLLQRGRPVMYVARSLTDAEKRYSTIEKELLAVVFALKRCHFYTYGRPVKVMTDHRSLLGLVESDLEQMSPRLRRFTERLFPYSLTWEYIPGKTNFIPDYLSRRSPAKPSQVEEAVALTFDAADKRFTRLLLGGGEFYQRLASESANDATFSYLRKCVTDGWPRRISPAHLEATKYWPLRHRLRVSGPFLLLEDDRVCVPYSLTAEAVQLLHLGHPGIVGMKEKARRVLYWPGWSRDVAAFVQGCLPCAAQAAAAPKPPLFSEPPPEFPGDQVAADHFQYQQEAGVSGMHRHFFRVSFFVPVQDAHDGVPADSSSSGVFANGPTEGVPV